jgi:hypothetical protein
VSSWQSLSIVLVLVSMICRASCLRMVMLVAVASSMSSLPTVEFGLEAVVARVAVLAIAAEDLHLVVDGVADAVEDHVEYWLCPQR